MTTEEILLQTMASLTKTNEEQGRQIAGLTEELKKMSAQIAWFQRQMFGRRSERNIAMDTQPGLFDAAELDALNGPCKRTARSRHGFWAGSVVCITSSMNVTGPAWTSMPARPSVRRNQGR